MGDMHGIELTYMLCHDPNFDVNTERIISKLPKSISKYIVANISDHSWCGIVTRPVCSTVGCVDRVVRLHCSLLCVASLGAMFLGADVTANGIWGDFWNIFWPSLFGTIF